MRAYPVLKPILACSALLLGLWACSPTFDWRDTRAENGAYTVLMPAKPSVFTRPVTLGGTAYPMTMTAAEVRQVTFAVGTVRVADPGMAAATLTAMKEALLKNAGATGITEKVLPPGGASLVLEVRASGAPDARGKPRALAVRYVAKGGLLVQALVAGPQDALTPELVDTFMTSLKVN